MCPDIVAPASDRSLAVVTGYPRAVTSLRAFLDRALLRLARVGAEAADDEETRLRKALLVLISILVWPISIIWATLFLALGSWTGLFAAAYFIISVASVVLFARTRNTGAFLRIQLLDILIAPTISMIPLGGFLGSGAVGLWGLLAPLGALVFGGVRSGVRWYVAFVAMFLGSGALGSIVGPVAPVPALFANVILGLNVAVGGTVFFTLLALFAKQREDALGALRSEQERAENLLLNILPASIARTAEGLAHDDRRPVRRRVRPVRGRRRLHAAHRADVAGRGRRHARPPVQPLRHARRAVRPREDQDDRRRVHGRRRSPEPRPDHATALANLALDMVSCVEPGGDVGDLGLTLRIGINSGPVVAGVIGRKKFLYDLWGDAVNIASRMESQGTPGRIQITEPTHELLGAEFDLRAARHRSPSKARATWRPGTWSVGDRFSGLVGAKQLQDRRDRLHRFDRRWGGEERDLRVAAVPEGPELARPSARASHRSTRRSDPARSRADGGRPRPTGRWSSGRGRPPRRPPRAPRCAGRTRPCRCFLREAAPDVGVLRGKPHPVRPLGREHQRDPVRSRTLRRLREVVRGVERALEVGPTLTDERTMISDRLLEPRGACPRATRTRAPALVPRGPPRARRRTARR